MKRASKQVDQEKHGMWLLLNGVQLDENVRTFLEYLLATLEEEE